MSSLQSLSWDVRVPEPILTEEELHKLDGIILDLQSRVEDSIMAGVADEVVQDMEAELALLTTIKEKIRHTQTR